MHEITLICDNCEQHFILSDGMDLPPHWLGVQITIGNSDGCARSGAGLYKHFCARECLQEYAGGEEMKYYLTMVDRKTSGESN